MLYGNVKSSVKGNKVKKLAEIRNALGSSDPRAFFCRLGKVFCLIFKLQVQKDMLVCKVLKNIKKDVKENDNILKEE